MAKFIVTGEEVDGIDRKMCEFKRQIRQKSGSPLDPSLVSSTLQELIEGKFKNEEDGGVSAVRMFNPHTYFKTREGLWVSDGFTSRVLVKQPTTMSYCGLDGATSHTLARSMADQQTIDEMLGGMDEVRSHAFTLDQIAAKIDIQPNGEDGELLNNGYANIFYVLVDGVLFAVYVSWDSDNRKWRVRGWHLGEYGKWYAGDRVFRNKTLVI